MMCITTCFPINTMKPKEKFDLQKQLEKLSIEFDAKQRALREQSHSRWGEDWAHDPTLNRILNELEQTRKILKEGIRTLPTLTDEIIQATYSEHPRSYKVESGWQEQWGNVFEVGCCLGVDGVEVSILDSQGIVQTVLRNVQSLDEVLNVVKQSTNVSLEPLPQNTGGSELERTTDEMIALKHQMILSPNLEDQD